MPALPAATRRTQVEDPDSLNKELEVTELMLRGIKDGLIFLDPEGRIGRINPAMEGILGVKYEHARGRPLREVVKEGEVCLMITGSTGGGRVFAVKGREYEVASTEMRDTEGRPLGVMSVFRDVTERRRLEQEKADFLSMVTHDLKSPLTTVLGYTALLLEGGMGELNADVGESVEAIDRSGKKLLSLIEDFMTLCRYDSGVKAPAFAPVHMGRIAEAVVSSCWPEASRTGKLLELHAPPELPSVPGDPKQLERLLGNLIDNALKFTGRDGHIVVTLAVREEEDVAGKLGTKPVSRGRHLEVSVKDDGIGVPEAELPHLFERYWRGRQSGAFKGSGLGLAIVKCLADGHGASIKAESVEGSGSAFYVWLPLSPTRP